MNSCGQVRNAAAGEARTSGFAVWEFLLSAPKAFALEQLLEPDVPILGDAGAAVSTEAQASRSCLGMLGTVRGPQWHCDRCSQSGFQDVSWGGTLGILCVL